ncbi:ESX secretion-associated protein EspG [Nocardia mangyaensis]|uniref:ESX secretion-associated protein EspG n=1 Tax=Nocardia mangyaensis TaxID=2213200 RepID=UPI002676C168|nr:ESX secretion-associated protein EspG [Nocardia mangyaensis]MDO3651253.1 ESX secretion-associated protein EspG [Nocardia mangyaensis]
MTSNTQWRFTPDEFAWVWSQTGREYPYPVSILESAADLDAYVQQRHAISSRYPHRADPNLTHALEILADPEVRIVCTGQYRGQRIRCLAVAVGDHAVIAHQLASSTREFGADVEILATRRQNLGRAVVTTMPATPAGAVPRLVGYTPRVRGEAETSYFINADGHEVAENRILALLRAPRSADGHLYIENDVRAAGENPPQCLNWIDIQPGHRAAGRYLIDVNHHDATVVPATDSQIANDLTHRANR